MRLGSCDDEEERREGPTTTTECDDSYEHMVTWLLLFFDHVIKIRRTRANKCPISQVGKSRSATSPHLAMVRCVQIVLLLLACVNALVVPRAPSALRMRSRVCVMATPTAEGEEIDFDAPISAAIAVGNIVKDGEGGIYFTQPVLDDCDVDDPRPEVRVHLFTDYLCFRSSPFIVAPTVHRHRRSTRCTHGCGEYRRISS